MLGDGGVTMCGMPAHHLRWTVTRKRTTCDVCRVRTRLKLEVGNGSKKRADGSVGSAQKKG